MESTVVRHTDSTIVNNEIGGSCIRDKHIELYSHAWAWPAKYPCVVGNSLFLESSLLLLVFTAKQSRPQTSNRATVVPNLLVVHLEARDVTGQARPRSHECGCCCCCWNVMTGEQTHIRLGHSPPCLSCFLSLFLAGYLLALL